MMSLNQKERQMTVFYGRNGTVIMTLFEELIVLIVFY